MLFTLLKSTILTVWVTQSLGAEAPPPSGDGPDATIDAVSSDSAEAWHSSNDLGGYQLRENVIPDEILVFGDIHGDYPVFRYLLEHAAAINSNGNWIADPDSTRYLIQLGDVVDRGPRSREAYEQIEKMRDQARESGDDVLSLYGNHELFILCGNYRYFSPEELDTYYDGKSTKLKEEFSPKGDLGKSIRQHYLPALRLNDTTFVHAGFDDLYRSHTVDELRKELITAIDDRQCVDEGEYNSVLGIMGPFWTRKVSNSFKNETPTYVKKEGCNYVDDLKAEMNVEKFVVGHTPTQSGNIESWCNGSWILHDSGMSRWMAAQPRFSVFYKTFDRKGAVKPLSEWIHVMWEPNPNRPVGQGPLVGTFLNDGGLSVADREAFIRDRLIINTNRISVDMKEAQRLAKEIDGYRLGQRTNLRLRP